MNYCDGCDSRIEFTCDSCGATFCIGCADELLDEEDVCYKCREEEEEDTESVQ